MVVFCTYASNTCKFTDKIKINRGLLKSLSVSVEREREREKESERERKTGGGRERERRESLTL